MQILQGFILGLIQGLTEFLPVSSSGHLVLFQNLFGMEGATQSFSILLHLATLIAVFIYYWKDIFELICHPFQRTTLLLVLATLPTVIIALLFNDTFDSIFGSGKFIGFNFIITAGVLMYAQRQTVGKKKVRNMSLLDALIVGTLQGLAILPAISRSGMTVSACLSRGVNRENAARFSFLLSIPAILGGAVFTIKDMIGGENTVVDDFGIMPMAVGFVTAAVSGYFAIRFMVNIIKKGRLEWFAMYTFALGVVLLLDQFVLHLIIT
ncbi:MAG: undecaprenyl-diphosphate phosphatase [Bacillota bacterium]